jgi:hypothetical protein
MVHSTQTEFISSSYGALPAFRPSSGAYQPHITRDHVRLASGAWPSLSLAEPEIDSLWDSGLLDRLSAPITRYHE